MIRNSALGLLLLLAGASVTFAQDRPETRTASSAPTITVSISAKGVRFAALGSVKQMRLEVFGADGDSLYNSDFQAGSVRDWKPEDKQGLRLPDGTYLCVVTFRDVSGRIGMKQGAILVQGGQVALQLAEGGQVGAVEVEKLLAPVTDNAATAITLTAHDGNDGQVVSTRGGLTFRAGDFFAGKDKELMRLTPEGDLGVGVTTPKAKLDVAGTIRARGGILFDDGTVLNSAGRAAKGAPGDPSHPAAGDTTAANVAGAGTANQLAKWADGFGTLSNSTVSEVAGNVGIGTIAPTAKLQIVSADSSVAPALSIRQDTNPLYGFDFALDTKVNGNLFFNKINNGASTNLITFDRAGGNIGIGTTTPSAKLHIISADASVAPALSIRQDTSPLYGFDFALDTKVNGNLFVNKVNNGASTNLITLNRTNGNVGIGTTAPSAKLHIISADAAIAPALSIRQDTNPLYGFDFALDTKVNGNMFVNRVNNGVGMNLITFDRASGNVGIGVTSPQSKLEIAGDVKVAGNAVVAGNIAAKYQDIAEWVPTQHQMVPGTVVILDATRANAVLPSSRAYDIHVAGVVSAQPGVTLGQGGAGRVLVATTGRVKVNVDATRHPIKIGDLLVTSGRPGMAMRSQPIRAGGTLIHRPGTIIGKALEPLASGEGEILVLLSLQ